MASKKIYDFYEKLPSWGKGVVVIGVGLAAWTIYNRIYGSIKRNKITRESKETVNATISELGRLMKNGIAPSYPEIQYKVWADAAYSCYAGWGTCSGDTIFVNLKNDADVLKLIQAFGVRTIPAGSFSPFSDFTGSLPAVMRDELSVSEIKSINKTLAQKGIKYQF
jgi:hypothetical protein